jgi:succinate dehydrogenase/fumarate reductase iron-sulfur protein
MTWRVRYRIARTTGNGSTTRHDTFTVEIRPDETVLDGIELVWARQDRTLAFRHACHHASCGSCGLRVNGVEKLPCVTPVQDVTADGGTLTIEPLRSFPLLGDLVVDPALLFKRMQQVGMPVIRHAEPLGKTGDFHRFENCIECGLCLSACPVMLASPHYLGPAALAAAERVVAEPRGADVPSLLRLLDGEHGVWQCHSAFECTEVCPSDVNPAGAIMALRARLIRERIKGLFGRGALAPSGGGRDTKRA